MDNMSTDAERRGEDRSNASFVVNGGQAVVVGTGEEGGGKGGGGGGGGGGQRRGGDGRRSDPKGPDLESGMRNSSFVVGMDRRENGGATLTLAGGDVDEAGSEGSGCGCLEQREDGFRRMAKQEEEDDDDGDKETTRLLQLDRTPIGTERNAVGGGILKAGGGVAENGRSPLYKPPKWGRSAIAIVDELLLLIDDPSIWFQKRGREVVERHAPILSGLLYCSLSCGMILLNKAVLSGYRFPGTFSLLLYQSLVSVLVILIGESCGWYELEPLTWRLCKVWLPVNCLFVGMIASGLYSLKYLTVPMVTVLKNLTNVITASGETAIYGKRHSPGVWSALGLIILSSVGGGVTDFTFTLTGYTWQMINCVLTAGYCLYLRHTMDTAKELTSTGRLGEVTMVMLNNVLSLPIGAALVVAAGEVEVLASLPLTKDAGFWMAATLTGVLGACLCFAVMWFLHCTSPTTFGLVGSLNKIPTSVIGVALFPTKMPITNIFSIALGLAAGVVFTTAKLQQQRLPGSK